MYHPNSKNLILPIQFKTSFVQQRSLGSHPGCWLYLLHQRLPAQLL
uniref:Uncharacterized protein n=1 Tax=Anguilla anguilla TaxID=7936 RepID=A0A0E9SSA7_ANGAN